MSKYGTKTIKIIIYEKERYKTEKKENNILTYPRLLSRHMK